VLVGEFTRDDDDGFVVFSEDAAADVARLAVLRMHA
jgi:hypothetical protein